MNFAARMPRPRTLVTPVKPPAASPLTPFPPTRESGWKAAVDYPLAAALLIATAPVVGLAMLAIRLTSRGPALYTQTRLGRGGRPFTIYKLRTMRLDAESRTGPRWSTPGDPRITPLGRVLRALHIDELPQLVNILKGEMSLIGPRPERPEIAAGLRKLIRGYDRRLAVLPGLTGWAQIHLPPDESVASVRRKLVYDRLYIRHRGLPLDVRILVCTGLKVLGLRWLYQKKVATDQHR